MGAWFCIELCFAPEAVGGVLLGFALWAKAAGATINVAAAIRRAVRIVSYSFGESPGFEVGE
jgi:hypothetical protein